jgi:uncharacterized protein (TIGR03067 family)
MNQLKPLLLVPVMSALLVGANSPEKAADKKPTSEQVKVELAKLQGTWVAVKTLADGKVKPPDRTEKITFKGNQLIFHVVIFEGTPAPPPQEPKGKLVRHEKSVIFSIDPAKRPKTMDLTFPGATTPDGKDFLFAQGIYLLEGDNLKLAFKTGQGQGDLFPRGRPTGFDGKDQSTTTILRR